MRKEIIKGKFIFNITGQLFLSMLFMLSSAFLEDNLTVGRVLLVHFII